MAKQNNSGTGNRVVVAEKDGVTRTFTKASWDLLPPHKMGYKIAKNLPELENGGRLDKTKTSADELVNTHKDIKQPVSAKGKQDTPKKETVAQKKQREKMEAAKKAKTSADELEKEPNLGVDPLAQEEE